MGLTKWCATFIEQGFARSSTALAVSIPTRSPCCPRTVATAVGLFRVVGLYGVVDPRSGSLRSL